MPEGGKIYGHYEVVSTLGRGAMGTVFLARDKRIGRQVALKTVNVDGKFDETSEVDEFYKRLQREAELCGALTHPNIVTLFEPGYDDDRIAWLATEYVDGETLRDLLRRKRPLELEEALGIGEGILRGLAFAHTRGIIHRDIKPANILLTKHGEAKIADFGIARPLDSNLTGAGSMLGTPSYMSPEQVKCTMVTPRSDLFSVGALLYEMLTGVKVFAGTDVGAILRNVVEMDPTPVREINAAVPEGIDKLVSQLLAKNPADRPASAVDALQMFLAARAGTEFKPEPLRPAEEVETIASDPLPQTRTAASTQLPADAAIGRHLPTWMFAVVMLLLGITIGAVFVAVKTQLDEPPVDLGAVSLERETTEKKIALAEARRRADTGDYAGAVSAYDRLIEEYPESNVARDERAAAVAKMSVAPPENEVDVTARRKKVAAPPKDEPRKPAGFLQRLKRIFRRG